jgi:hypothetical protein
MAKVMSEQTPAKPSADGIVAAAQAVASNGKARGLPPVHLWNPPFTGDIDIKIARDGTWYHEGSPINRHKLLPLFSSILRKEGDAFFLVTPVEKVRITVEDAPFVAVDFEVIGQGQGQVLTFETHVGDFATASSDNPIRVAFAQGSDTPSPYVMVRAGLEALIDRKSFYRLVDLGDSHEVDGQSWFGVWAGGQFFPLIPEEELAAG